MEVDPIQGMQNVIYALLGVCAVFLVLVVSFRGIGHLMKNNVNAILGLIGIAIILGVFMQGETSKELLEGLSDTLINYMKGN